MAKKKTTKPKPVRKPKQDVSLNALRIVEQAIGSPLKLGHKAT